MFAGRVVFYTGDSSTISTEEVACLREHGLSDAEIVEIQGVMELFAGYNKFIDSLAVDIGF